jgi:hypothetical protein
MNLSNRNHRSKGFEIIFEELDKLKGNGKLINIIETGTMRKDSPDGDGNALELFEEYTIGNIYSVDIDEEAVEYANTKKINYCTTIILMDSVDFLKSFKVKADLYYLDSFDYDPNRPYESAIHHLNELLAIYNNGFLRNCIIAVDDNFGDKGKGILVEKFFNEIPYAKLICDGYLKVWKIE